MKLNFLVPVLAFAAISQAMAETHVYRPQVLTEIEHRVTTTLQQGKIPVVVFDLDDTLINTRDRTLRILEDLSSEREIQSGFPEETTDIANLSASNVQFDLSTTLTSVGIQSTAFVTKSQQFWLSHFFTNEFVANDVPNPGAVEYVNRLYQLGARIVYLTGRDEPRMGEGTRADLAKLGFPLGGENAILLLEPKAAGNDLAFKVSQFPRLRQEGEVVASFENEPMNINAFQVGFPQAEMVFLDTIHSDSPVVPNDGISWIPNFFEPMTRVDY